MRTARTLVATLLVASALVTASAWAAPVESVDSGRAKAAWQKVDAFLGQQQVTQQLASLGLSREQARARLARLTDAQLEALAVQIDMLQAGGTIQGDNPHPLGPLGCILAPMGRFLYNIYQVLFCWGQLA